MAETKENINRYRPMLFSIAYNMLGTIADAEDMVQETYASWLETEKPHVQNVKFYLIRTVSNKCLTYLKKIEKEREAYTGTWLPEPLFSPWEEDNKDFKANLSIGFLYLLEKLTPVERGVIILKEAFDLKYVDISAIFEITEDNCRQHLSRAKKKLSIQKSRFKADTGEHEKILRKFLDACFNKDLEGIIDLLSEDVTAYADGGGKAPAILNPLSGRDYVMRLLVGGTEKAKPYRRMEIIPINGFSCAAFYPTDQPSIPDVLIAIDVDEKHKITNIYYVANPEKLRNINPQIFD